jgi:hypothetical protein
MRNRTFRDIVQFKAECACQAKIGINSRRRDQSTKLLGESSDMFKTMVQSSSLMNATTTRQTRTKFPSG